MGLLGEERMKDIFPIPFPPLSRAISRFANMRIGTKLLLGFIPLAILTAMVAEALYINSKRIDDSSLLVKESYRTYADILEMRRHEKNFYLYRIKDTSGRAAESFSRLKRLAGKNQVASQFTKAEELLRNYQRLTDLLL